jgi:hypothetical protein
VPKTRKKAPMLIVPSVHFDTLEGYMEAKEATIQKLLGFVREELRSEDCEPTRVSNRFLEAWGSKAEAVWLWLCKGGSMEWARFMTARCVVAMKTMYSGVQKANEYREVAFPHNNLAFVVELLEGALKRLLGKKGPPSALVAFEDHNFQKTMSKDEGYTVKPVFGLAQAGVSTVSRRRMALMPFDTVNDYVTAFEEGMHEYRGVVRDALDKEESGACLRFGGLAYKAKMHVREEGLKILQSISKQTAPMWCQMMQELLEDILETACFAYTCMNHLNGQQQNNGQHHMLLLLINDAAGKDALGEFLGGEVRSFFDENELKGDKASCLKPSRAPCYLMHVAHEVNVPVIKAVMEEDVPMPSPAYLTLKLRRDVFLFRLAMRRVGKSVLSQLSVDVMNNIFKQYKRVLMWPERRVDFCEASYIREERLLRK